TATPATTPSAPRTARRTRSTAAPAATPSPPTRPTWSRRTARRSAARTCAVARLPRGGVRRGGLLRVDVLVPLRGGLVRARARGGGGVGADGVARDVLERARPRVRDGRRPVHRAAADVARRRARLRSGALLDVLARRDRCLRRRARPARRAARLVASQGNAGR